MPPLTPIKRSELIKLLRKAGFDGPESGGKHQFMVKGKLKLTIPNPHRGEISVGLLNRPLKQAVISVEEWQKLL